MLLKSVRIEELGNDYFDTIVDRVYVPREALRSPQVRFRYALGKWRAPLVEVMDEDGCWLQPFEHYSDIVTLHWVEEGNIGFQTGETILDESTGALV